MLAAETIGKREELGPESRVASRRYTTTTEEFGRNDVSLPPPLSYGGYTPYPVLLQQRRGSLLVADVVVMSEADRRPGLIPARLKQRCASDSFLPLPLGSKGTSMSF